MSEIIEETAKEYREEVKKREEERKKREEERKKNIINIRWEQYVKLSNKLYEIIEELRDYNSLGKGLTKEESSKMADLVDCRHAFDDKIKKVLRDEQQFSEIMEKLYSIVQEALDFLEKIRIKYGNNIKEQLSDQEESRGTGIFLVILAIFGIIIFSFYSCMG